MTKKYKNALVSCHRFGVGDLYGDYGFVIKIINSHTTDNKQFKDYTEYEYIKVFEYYYNRVPFNKEGIEVIETINK